ncbi:MAG: hypothetical protein D6797_01090, partial [Bdellovibrio sp.]
MEKISSILPSNSRITNVDLSQASGAARPGSPAFGRKIGVSTSRKGLPETTASRAVREQQALLQKRSQDQLHAEIV